MRLQFGLDTYQHRFKSVAAQRILNAYMEKAPQGSKNPVALVGSYGIADYATAGNGPHRGGTVVKGVPYVVSGDALYRINADKSADRLGTIPNIDRVTMAGDGTRLMTASGGRGYVWNGTTVVAISDPDLPGVEWVQYLDGYFVAGWEGSVYVSAPFDPMTWNALDFAGAEASPDNIVGAIVEKRELFLGGQDSIEVFVNTGNADFPLERIPSGFSEIGLLSKFGMAKADNSVFFPATDFTVRRMQGYTPVVISTPVISQAIEDLSDKTLFGMAWTEGGHTFYSMSCSEWTKVYDCSTQLWHDRSSYGHAFWRPAMALNAYGQWLVGDQMSNRLGSLSPLTFAEWGEHQIMLATAYVPPDANAQIDVPRLEIVFDAGNGLVEGQGSDPMMMIRQSITEGQTWGNSHERSMGKIGEFRRRAVWNRAGYASLPVPRTFEVSISDRVRRSLSYANFGPEPGDR